MPLNKDLREFVALLNSKELSLVTTASRTRIPQSPSTFHPAHSVTDDRTPEATASPRGVALPSSWRISEEPLCRSCPGKSVRAAWISDTPRSCARLRSIENPAPSCGLRRSEKREAGRCGATLPSSLPPILPANVWENKTPAPSRPISPLQD